MGIGSGRDIDRQHAGRPSAQRVQAGVGRDAVQPCSKRRPALELVALAPGAQQGLLHQVLGVLHRAEHPVAVQLKLAPVPLHRRHEESFVIRADRGVHGVLLLQSRHTDYDASEARN